LVLDVAEADDGVRGDDGISMGMGMGIFKGMDMGADIDK